MVDGAPAEQWAARIEQLAAEIAADTSLSAAQHSAAAEALRDARDALRAPQRATGVRMPRIGGGDPAAGVALGRIRRRHAAD